ncbi:hypothetical protein GCM10023321_40010 [Pseudonocardia eucalypti]|uniref:Uncharacterized protein n=1 Tax=Pseudonocardia eucalypti TaxID=648755 RepID=A0ABP9QBX2_9PSEU
MVTHWISSVLAPKSFWMDGTATFTMVMSRSDMNMPTISTASGTTQPPFAVLPPETLMIRTVPPEQLYRSTPVSPVTGRRSTRFGAGTRATERVPAPNGLCR